MLIIYLAFVFAALYCLSRVLLPELLKPPVPSFKKVSIPVYLNTSETVDKRIEKLEILLSEKNKNINLLQTELKVFQVQVRNFDRVKTLLEEEIHRLREQNQIFRSELGLPTNQPKENTTRLFI